MIEGFTRQNSVINDTYPGDLHDLITLGGFQARGFGIENHIIQAGQRPLGQLAQLGGIPFQTEIVKTRGAPTKHIVYCHCRLDAGSGRRSSA